MNFYHKIKCFCLIGFLLFSQKTWSSLRLEKGSYANPTLIDTLTASTNLNFTYHGCDPTPNPENIELVTDGDCRLVREYDLGQSDGLKSASGTIGEMIVRYKNDQTDCSRKYTKTLHTRLSLKDAYEKFESKKCYPTHLLIRDSARRNSRYVFRTRKQKGLCTLPKINVSKEGFPTEDHDFFNLSANEDGFKIGDHTHYRYNHNSEQWCVSYRKNPYKCGQFPSPLPMAYKNTGTGRTYLKAVVSLSPDGGASIFAIDKNYPNVKAMFEDQKKGNFTKVDHTKGRIDFRTWQKDNGIPRSMISSYEYDPDNPNGRHQRSLNFFPRNSFGVGITRSWCPEEHCFLGMNADDIIASRCQGKTGESLEECKFNIKKTSCGKDPKIELSRGGNGNSCHSCLGITPGVCAIETHEVNIIKNRLIETDTLRINDQGEYVMKQGVESGLAANYAHIAEKPKKRGCFDGYARDSLDIFDSREPGVRAATSVKKNEPEKPEPEISPENTAITPVETTSSSSETAARISPKAPAASEKATAITPEKAPKKAIPTLAP